MDPQLSSGFRLDGFDVLPLQNEIVADGETRHVQPKAMDVLCCLARRAGQVVERQAILDEVWDRNVVADDVLTRCVSELRSALGDAAVQSRFIQTVPKRGYRLLVEPRPIESAPDAPTETAAPVAPPSPAGLFEEIKKRSVFRVGVAYAAVAWLIIEVSGTIFPHLGIPDAAVRAIVIIAMIGFPIALALAWVFEITPDGIVIDRPGARHRTLLPNRLRRLDVVTVLALIVVGGAVAYQRMQGDAPPDVNEALFANANKSIAILPFDNLSGSPDKAYFGDGLAEDLIHLLTKARQLRVSPRVASFYYKDKDLDPNTIAERLQVGTILTGSVRINDDTIIVNAELLDIGSGMPLWTDRIERPAGDIFKLQNEIASMVVEQLKVELNLSRPLPDDYRSADEIVGAYEYFSRAREYLRRPSDEETLANAETLLNRAIDIDPGFAQAYALMCELNLERYRVSYASDTASFERAEQQCHRAKTLDSSDSDVFLALGALYRYSGQYGKSRQELQAAIEQSPLSVQAYVELGLTLSESGEFDNAERMLRAAVELDPGYFRAHRELGNFLFARQRYAEAAGFFENRAKLTPGNAAAYNNVAAAYFMLNDFSRASDAWQKSLQLGETRSTYTNLGLSYYYLGRFADAVEMQEKAAAIAPRDHRIWGRLAESARFVDGMQAVSADAYAKAIEFAGERLGVNPRDWETVGLLALYLAHAGERERSLTTLGRGLALAPQEPDMHYFAALAYLELGDEASAHDELKQSLDLGFSPRLVEADPDIAPLLNQGRFQALLADRDGSRSANRGLEGEQ